MKDEKTVTLELTYAEFCSLVCRQAALQLELLDLGLSSSEAKARWHLARSSGLKLIDAAPADWHHLVSSDFKP